MKQALPKALSAEELESAVRAVLAEVGASGPGDMGKAMGAANKALAGKADGKAISELVKSILASMPQ